MNSLHVGPPRRVFREATRVAEPLFRPLVPGLVDVVKAEAYARDEDYWITTDALGSAAHVTMPGGWLVLVAECRMGLVDGDPKAYCIFRQHGNMEFNTLREFGFGDGRDVPLAVILSHTSYLRGRRVVIVSESLTEGDGEKLGVSVARSVQEALKVVADGGASMSRLGIIRDAGRVIPLARRWGRGGLMMVAELPTVPRLCTSGRPLSLPPGRHGPRETEALQVRSSKLNERLRGGQLVARRKGRRRNQSSTTV
jgi:hypothetical protein